MIFTPRRFFTQITHKNIISPMSEYFRGIVKISNVLKEKNSLRFSQGTPIENRCTQGKNQYYDLRNRVSF